MRILLDLDCTLADFVGGCAALWGLTFRDLEPHWPAGHYGMETILAMALGDNFTYEAQFDGLGNRLDAPSFAGRMWAGIEARPGFWADLPELPWCRQLLDAVRTTTDDWWIATSPSRCPRCIPEKRAWLDRVLGLNGRWFDRLLPTPHKELMAKPGVLLIDDYEKHCKDFVKEGGHAVLFPAHHNSLHDLKDDPLEYVLGAVESWSRGLPKPYRCGCPVVRVDKIKGFCPVHCEPTPLDLPAEVPYHGSRG